MYNIVYGGIQEGISYDLHIFTEKTTGGTFGIRTTVEDIEAEINKKTKELIDNFNRRTL